MGPEHDSGVQARTPQGTCTNYPPQRGNSINLGAEPYQRGDPKDASERGHHRDTPGGSKTGLLLKPLSGSKERWRHEAGNKPKTPQRVRCPTPFQNGGDPHPERPAEEERLDDQSRSKRCLLHDPNSHLQQTSTSVLGERLPLSVHMPAIRPVQRSLGLYQDPEASDNPAQRARGKVSDLHRRYSRHGGDTGNGEGPHPRPDLPSGEPRFHCTPRENTVNPNTGDRIPGDASRLTHDGTACPGNKAKEDQSRGGEDQRSTSHTLSSRNIPPAREAERNISSYPPGAPVLQVDTERPREGSRPRQSVIRRALPTVTSGHGRAHLVEQSADQVEWEKPSPQETGLADRIRRIPNRVGSVPEHEGAHGRSVVHCGNGLPHKLPGASCCHIGGQDISEGPGKQTRITANRQSNSSGVHKQSGRDSLRPSHDSSQRALDVVPREGNTADSTVPSRRVECQSGHRVESDEGSLRLDAEPVDFPTRTEPLPRHGDRSLCLTPLLPAPALLQLETRPPSGGNRCLPSTLERAKGIRKPTMEPCRQGPVTGGRTESGPGGAGGPCLAIATMVSKPTQPPGSPSIENQPPSRGGCDDRGVGGSSARDNPTLSRVAYLRRHYSEKKISGEATDLLLSSWRQKSSQSYDSLCKKWISWCTERNLDPVSGPIEDVVNFLAHLFNEGYQYRSLNSYRSAIASMHAPIDGVSIGQHPLVSRLLRGAFQSRPPLPRYTETWDVSKVLTHLNSHNLEGDVSLKLLTLRTVMLLALTRPSRSTDLAKLNLAGFRNSPEGAVFLPAALAKQSSANKTLKDFFFPRFTENVRLCPVHSLSLYIERTKQIRGTATQLFVSLIKPHLPVTSSTVARWLKQVIGDSGIDTDTFKAHSVRSASTSAASNQGVTTEEILKAADWSSDSTFQRFYYKPVRDATFAKTVLSVSYKGHN